MPVPSAVPLLLGESPAMRQVRRKLQDVAQSPAPVLFLGETGTGKEVAARYLHSLGRGGPFVPINCPGLISSLLGSELFGHVRGAFTGATDNHTGQIELAHGGTAFFDEIGELSTELQTRLLRLLQDKEYRPVGSNALRRSEFRLMAATNRELEREVEAGRFRLDLYYRVKVITVRMPPLRDRREDIPLLAEHFRRCLGASTESIAGYMPAMLRHEWPGNVRELEHCIQAIAATGTVPTGLCAEAPAAVPEMLHGSGALLPMSELRRERLLKALEISRGDKTRAARILGVGRTSLYRMLKEFGLENRK